MAKIKHNNFIDTVDQVLSSPKNEAALHLYVKHKILAGSTTQNKTKEKRHFGTIGYFGLETINTYKNV